MNPMLPSARARRWGGAAATVVLALGLGACGSEDDDAPDASSEASTEPTESAESGAAALPEWAPAIVEDADGSVVALDFTEVPEPGPDLEVSLVETGDGPETQSGQTLTVDYLGQVYDGAEPFDASYDREPFPVQIDVGQVIPGWDQALVGVPVGSRVLMSIPPDLGYGAAGSPPDIAPNSTLYFVVDVIEAA